MNIFIVNAFGRSNRGDSVLLDECIGELKLSDPGGRIGAAVYEGINSAASIHPDVTWSERIGNPRGARALAKVSTLWFLGLGVVALLVPAASKMLPKSQSATLEGMKRAEVIVSAPGGYIHDTNFAYYIALYHIALGALLGKRVILAPQSIGPIDGRFSRAAARMVLNSADVICARESYTKAFLINEIGVKPEHVVSTGDSAFWNDEVETDRSIIDAKLASLGITRSESFLGMTVVDWSFPKSKDVKKEKEQYAAKMASIAKFARNRFGMKTVIFNQVSEDLSMAHLVRGLAGDCVIVDEESHEPWLLRALIARSLAFVGTRFHSCIFSMMAGRPTVAISYLPKTSYIMKDLGLSGRQFPIESFELDEVQSLLGADVADVGGAEQEIRRAVTRYRGEFLRLSDVVRRGFK